MSTQREGNLNPGRDSQSNKNPPISNQKKGSFTSFIVTFVIALVAWFILSGRFDFLHISLGIISCAIVAWISGKDLVPPQKIGGLLKIWVRFIRYLPWLFFQIFVANIHVMRLTFHPNMMALIDPKIIRFKSRFEHEMSHFIFANSITLTPGTITIYVSNDGEYAVHAIDKKSGDSLPGEMEKRVFKILGE